MPTVPTKAAPEVAVQSAPAAFDQTRASAASFGGQSGQALQQAGAQLEDSTNLLGAVAIKQKQEDNSREADALVTKFRNSLRQTVFGDGTAQNPGFYSLKGEAAVQAQRGLQKQVTDMQAQIADEASSERVKAAYYSSTTVAFNSELEGIAKHTAAQRLVAADSADDGVIALAQKDATDHYNNPDKIEENVAVIMRRAQDKALRNGKSEADAVADGLIARSEVYAAVLNEQIARGETAMARDALETYTSRMTSKDRVPILKALKDADDHMRGVKAAAAFVESYGGDIEKAADALLRGEFGDIPPDVTKIATDTVLARASAMYAEESRRRAEITFGQSQADRARAEDDRRRKELAVSIAFEAYLGGRHLSPEQRTDMIARAPANYGKDDPKLGTEVAAQLATLFGMSTGEALATEDSRLPTELANAASMDLRTKPDQLAAMLLSPKAVADWANGILAEYPDLAPEQQSSLLALLLQQVKLQTDLATDTVNTWVLDGRAKLLEGGALTLDAALAAASQVSPITDPGVLQTLATRILTATQQYQNDASGELIESVVTRALTEVGDATDTERENTEQAISLLREAVGPNPAKSLVDTVRDRLREQAASLEGAKEEITQLGMGRMDQLARKHKGTITTQDARLVAAETLEYLASELADRGIKGKAATGFRPGEIGYERKLESLTGEYVAMVSGLRFAATSEPELQAGFATSLQGAATPEDFSALAAQLKAESKRLSYEDYSGLLTALGKKQQAATIKLTEDAERMYSTAAQAMSESEEFKDNPQMTVLIQSAISSGKREVGAYVARAVNAGQTPRQADVDSILMRQLQLAVNGWDRSRNWWVGRGHATDPGAVPAAVLRNRIRPGEENKLIGTLDGRPVYNPTRMQEIMRHDWRMLRDGPGPDLRLFYRNEMAGDFNDTIADMVARLTNPEIKNQLEGTSLAWAATPEGQAMLGDLRERMQDDEWFKDEKLEKGYSMFSLLRMAGMFDADQELSAVNKNATSGMQVFFSTLVSYLAGEYDDLQIGGKN